MILISKLVFGLYLCGGLITVIFAKSRTLVVHVSTPGYIGFTYEPNYGPNDASLRLFTLAEVSSYLYAQWHGYEYRRIIVPKSYMTHKAKQMTSEFAKAFGLRELIKLDYDTFVLMDLDVFIMKFNVSIESKMEEWNPTAQIYMPNDPIRETTEPAEPGVRPVNTGFQVWKKTDITVQVVKNWTDFDSEANANCTQYMTHWTYDQAYMNVCVRPNIPAGVFHNLSCSEANGFADNVWNPFDNPKQNHGNGGCTGDFVSHFWQESKHFVKPMLKDMVFDALVMVNNTSPVGAYQNIKDMLHWTEGNFTSDLNSEQRKHLLFHNTAMMLKDEITRHKTMTLSTDHNGGWETKPQKLMLRSRS